MDKDIKKNDNVITTGLCPFKVLWQEYNEEDDVFREISAIETSDGVVLRSFYRTIENCGENIVTLKGVKLEDLG